MHSIRRAAALIEPVVAVAMAVLVGARWWGADTAPWTMAGYVGIGALAAAGLGGVAGLRTSLTVLVRAAMSIGVLVAGLTVLPDRPLALQAAFGVLALVYPLVLPGRLSGLVAVLVALGFGTGSLVGTGAAELPIGAGGTALLACLGLGAAWAARLGPDPIPDTEAPEPGGDGFLGVAFDTAAGGLALLDAGARVVRANQALGDMLGRAHQSLTGSSWWALLGPEDAGVQEARFAKLLAGEIWNFQLESRLRTRNRRLITAMVAMSAVADAAGAPHRVFVQVVNIDDRARNELRMRHRVEEMRRNFDQAPVPMWEIGLDEIAPLLERWQRDRLPDLAAYFEAHPDVLRHMISTLDIRDANQAAKELVGAAGREEFVRGVRGGRLGPGLVEALGRHLDAIWRGRHDDARVVELVDFDGTGHAGMIQMRFVAAAEDEAAGSMLVAFTDLADLLGGQEALSTLDARLRAVVAAAPIVLFATDATGLLTVWEGKAVDSVGLTAGEIVGRSVFEVFGGAPSMVAAMRRALDGEGLTMPVEVAERTLSVRFSPIFERGRVAGVIGLGVEVAGAVTGMAVGEPGPDETVHALAGESADVWEQPALLETDAVLEEPERVDADEDSAGGDEPAAVLEELLAFDDLLADGDEPDAEADQTYALEIQPSDLDLSELGALLGDLDPGDVDDDMGSPAIVEIDTAGLPLLVPALAAPSGSAVDLWDLYDDVAAEHPPRKPVATNRDGSGAKVFADSHGVRTVLAELLSNAGAHGGAHLTVRVDRLGEDLALSVIDDGPGLDAATVAGVFGAGSGGGTLGELKRHAEAMGGQLTYDYRQGHSIFTLSLPAA